MRTTLTLIGIGFGRREAAGTSVYCSLMFSIWAWPTVSERLSVAQAKGTGDHVLSVDYQIATISTLRRSGLDLAEIRDHRPPDAPGTR